MTTTIKVGDEIAADRITVGMIVAEDGMESFRVAEVSQHGDTVLLTGEWVDDDGVTRTDAETALDIDTVVTVVRLPIDEPPTCILSGEDGENPDDCTTHSHEGDALTGSDGPRPWWLHRGELAMLAQHMLDQGETTEIVYMIEKPWKFDDEWRAARAAAEEGA